MFDPVETLFVLKFILFLEERNQKIFTFKRQFILWETKKSFSLNYQIRCWLIRQLTDGWSVGAPAPGTRRMLSSASERNLRPIFHKFLRTLWLISSYCTMFSVRTGRLADGRLSRLSAGFTWDLDPDASWQASRKSCVKQIMSEEVWCCRDDQRSARSSTSKTNAENKDESSSSGSGPARYIQNTEQYPVLSLHCWACWRCCDPAYAPSHHHSDSD